MMGGFRHVGALAAALVLGTGLALVGPAPATAADPITKPVTISGHGFGHGRGLGQYGSYGYAVDLGWSYQAILDRYYGGTRLASDDGNPDITVELLAMRGKDTVVTGSSLVVNSVAVGHPAVWVRRDAAGQFVVLVAPGCGGPWSPWSGVLGSGVTITSAAGGPDDTALLRLCEPGQVRGYRGALQVFEGAGFAATVNRLPVDAYLRGVVPRESPAAWGSAGGGRGMEALRAQAVAARSYARASSWTPYAKTCDTTTCQVYGGAFTEPFGGQLVRLEDSRTDTAVQSTSGQVRRWSNGSVVRTEFSSSTGGWTAGGDFPAVEDAGDATSVNPNHSWSVALEPAVLAQRPVIGAIPSR